MQHNPHPPTRNEKRATQARILADLAARLDEEIVAAQWFYAGGRWSSLKLTTRAARLVLGRRRLDDGLARTGALAVTPSRVLVFEIEPDRDSWLADAPAFDWPRTGVGGTVRKLVLTEPDDGGIFDDDRAIEVRRATLRTPDGVLIADLPSGDRTTVRLIAALGLKTGKGPWQRLVDQLGGP